MRSVAKVSRWINEIMIWEACLNIPNQFKCTQKNITKHSSNKQTKVLNLVWWEELEASNEKKLNTRELCIKYPQAVRIIISERKAKSW